jgi:hypothetical protein
MKRVVNIMLCALMALSLTACEGLEELLGDKFGDIIEDVIDGGENNDEGENLYPSESIPIRFEGVEYVPFSYWTVYTITKSDSNSSEVITENYNPDEYVVIHFELGKRMELYKGMEKDGELLLYYEGIYGEWTLDEVNRTMTITRKDGDPKTYNIQQFHCNEIGNGVMTLRINEQYDGLGGYTTTTYHLIGRNSEYFTYKGGSFEDAI